MTSQYVDLSNVSVSSASSYPNLERVTFTGADDSVKAEDLLSVSKRYPKAEWGILFGAGANGGKRFPSVNWLVTNLPKMKGLNLCAHLCGRFVMDLVDDGKLTWQKVFHQKIDGVYLDELFKRVQINFHGMPTSPHPDFYSALIQEPFQFIFQDDVTNRKVWKKAVDAGVNAVRLFDVSHGAGVLPDDGWPLRTHSEYMGYAGGLGPQNILPELAAINLAAGNHGPYWIDMETRVRSNRDEQFDMTKVEDVLRQIYG